MSLIYFAKRSALLPPPFQLKVCNQTKMAFYSKRRPFLQCKWIVKAIVIFHNVLISQYLGHKKSLSILMYLQQQSA